MEELVKTWIKKEAERLAREYHQYHNNVEIEYQRNKKRIKGVPPKKIIKPEYWHVDKKFNPFYVLKHIDSISKSLSKKLVNGTYSPQSPYTYNVEEKEKHKKRETRVFQIPDAAISTYLYRRLLSKNKHRFSSLAYAYRDDRNVHYAIQDIAFELIRKPRVFVAEFDFKDFFGSVKHEYLFELLGSGGFLINQFETDLIKKFLIDDKGIPLGTSISLFLANAVCWKLDRNFEEEGIRFARYADDTVVWSTDYNKICKAFEIIYEFSQSSGIDINTIKSEGISLLQPQEMPSEFEKTKEYIEFLGYKLSGKNISIKQQSVNKIKKQISYLLYRNLIQPINTTPFRAVIIPSNNEDPSFVSAIMQIRRYLYGNLSEETLTKYNQGIYKKLSFKGIMSFYPLINNEDQLKTLDGWLLSSIFMTLKKREKILINNLHHVSSQFPYNLLKNQLIDACKTQSYRGIAGIMEIPSFLRIYKAIKKGVLNEGIDETMNRKSVYYNYF